METKQELKIQLEELDKKIVVLEWDKMRDQINPSKLAQLEELKKQRDKVIQDMENAPNEAPKEEKTTDAVEVPSGKDEAQEPAEEVAETPAEETTEEAPAEEVAEPTQEASEESEEETPAEEPQPTQETTEAPSDSLEKAEEILEDVEEEIKEDEASQ